MSESGRLRPQQTQFLLTPPPPVRSLAISAVAAVIAAAVLVLASALQLPRAVVIAGIVIMVFAFALAVVALVLTVRLRTTLILDPQSITIIKGRRRRVLDWSMIDSVKLQGARLKLITKPQGGADTTVLNPRSAADATFTALAADIGRRLDADRGYQRLQ
ncbi:MAG TPA: hypothetical protein VF241_04465 [Propionibacteriaceae bacterium]